MKLALYHGYELSGSGSNEYTRYLARSLAQAGHDVVLICQEPEPATYDFVGRAVAYDFQGQGTELFSRDTALAGRVSLHQLPRTSVYPVFLTDKQRDGVVKAFPDLTDDELSEYHDAMVAVVRATLEAEQPDVLHCNHLVYQPVVARQACEATGTPYYVVPHGSSIEYTVKQDERYMRLARDGVRHSAGLVWVSREVRDRVFALFDDMADALRAKSELVGVGTDTTLFRPIGSDQRGATIEELARRHVPGGKTPAQRDELRAALDAGAVDATRAYWDAYPHKLSDADLPAQLQAIPERHDLLLFVGAMTYGKGIQSLIAAMPAVLSRRPDTHLLLVGSGTYREVLEGLTHALVTGNESLFDEIVARGRDLERADMSGALEDLQSHASDPARRRALFEHGPRLDDRVHFLGRLDHDRLRLVLPLCRLGIFPSVIKEASPLVFAEAMACGVLPAASYHSGLKDGLDDLRPQLPSAMWKRMKLPVESDGRVATIASHVVELLELLDDADLGPTLRQIAVENYDWRSVADKLLVAVGRLHARAC